ncbi:helix-turn-helix transcriptional regulator [Hydrogenoanaerobacterium sp.]|uniref:helix-turn-helix domain-containing protein n=1 Tax=Hydrogenoanaerobacterium sp. TaxID=2953763 RepID=UPI0028A06410|nr:helix-turn-helix transcriptional regulator [Hydrogenoanaerobacterium sp.]
MIFQHIKDLREDADLSQAQIAQILGMAQNTYSQYETGKIAFTDEVLIKLADFYGASVDYLLDRTKEKRPYPAL